MFGHIRTIAAVFTNPIGLKYYLFGLRVWLKTAFVPYDFCHAMDVMALFAGRGIARRGIPQILDINEIPDLFERQGRQFVATPARVKRHLVGAITRDLRRTNPVIMTTSASLADYIQDNFGRPATAIRNVRHVLTTPRTTGLREDLQAPSTA